MTYFGAVGTRGFTMERERSEDGRWIAAVPGLPGMKAYGGSQQDALAKMESLALRVLVGRLGRAETVPDVVRLFFDRT